MERLLKVIAPVAFAAGCAAGCSADWRIFIDNETGQTVDLTVITDRGERPYGLLEAGSVHRLAIKEKEIGFVAAEYSYGDKRCRLNLSQAASFTHIDEKAGRLVLALPPC